jgi:hypothetical protein
MITIVYLYNCLNIKVIYLAETDNLTPRITPRVDEKTHFGNLAEKTRSSSQTSLQCELRAGNHSEASTYIPKAYRSLNFLDDCDKPTLRCPPKVVSSRLMKYTIEYSIQPRVYLQKRITFGYVIICGTSHIPKKDQQRRRR